MHACFRVPWLWLLHGYQGTLMSRMDAWPPRKLSSLMANLSFTQVFFSSGFWGVMGQGNNRRSRILCFLHTGRSCCQHSTCRSGSRHSLPGLIQCGGICGSFGPLRCRCSVSHGFLADLLFPINIDCLTCVWKHGSFRDSGFRYWNLFFFFFL